MNIKERLSVSHLRAAVEVHRWRSFTVAAENLKVSQSSLSRKIVGVERAVGTQLFRRTTRSVEPTTAGEAMIDQMRQVLGGFDAGMDQLMRHITGEQGTVTIGCLPSIAATYLPSVIRSFAQEYPAVRLEVQDGLLEQVVAGVRAGEVDFGIAPLATTYADLRYQRLGADKFYCAVPQGHHLVGQDSVRWAQLAGEPFIAFSPASSISRPVEAALAGSGVIPGPTMIGHNVGAVAGLVASGLGITAVPGLVRPLMEFAQLEFVPLTPAVEREFCIIRRAGESISAPAARFVNKLRGHGAYDGPGLTEESKGA